MMKNGDNQGMFITTIGMDKGGAVGLLIKSGFRGLKKAFRYVIQLNEVQGSHKRSRYRQ